MSVIDIHAHFIPRSVVDRAATGAGLDGLTVESPDGHLRIRHRQGYGYPFVDEFHVVPARLQRMDELGIDRAVVSISPTFYFYGVDAAEGRAYAEATNDELAAHVGEAPDRLAGLATLPIQDPEAAARELERAVRELGLRGASIGPRVDDDYLDHARFEPVLAAAEALGVPLLLHPFYVGLRPGLPDFYLTNLVGNPLESTIGAARLILSGTLDRHPRLRLALTHGGGYLPYQVGRLDHGHRVRPESKGCAEPPSTYLRRFVFDSVTHRPEALAFLVGLVGADRVAFGTDLPFDMMAGGPAEQLPAGLRDEERALVEHGTAEAWFGVFGGRAAPHEAGSAGIQAVTTGRTT